jgi:outer membrane protein assembly factor BamE (lipoprotein component of BamABCDE complex)
MLCVLVGCDQKLVEQLEEGVSTEADVRRVFGEPAAIHNDAGGVRDFEYPRQPEGQTTYFIGIGSDGIMSSLRQVLKDETFAKVTPGLDKVQVRRLLGRPAKTQTYALKQQEVWDWHYLNGQEWRVFSTTFDTNGRVLSTATSLDPRAHEAGGGNK